MAVLATLHDKVTHKVHHIVLRRTRIGRFHENHIILDHPMVSREHAVVTKGFFGLYIEDLKSKFGTFVNGKRIHSKTKLRHGDRILVAAPRCEEAEAMAKNGISRKDSTIVVGQPKVEALDGLSDEQLIIGADLEFTLVKS